MNRLITRTKRITAAAVLSFLAVFSALPAQAAYDIAQEPLFLGGYVPPLNMLVMGRDHKLYYEAYNDASDLDGDGDLDVGYKPADIDYYGYFNSYTCYTYSGGVFRPSSTTTDKTCSGAWSGDFLNYLTTSRIDALRKVLYGGKRSTDTTSETILERSHIPQDAHSWGKEYDPATAGYNISDYTPYANPSFGNRHLFANTTLLGDSNQLPRLRVVTNTSARIWSWVSKERPVAGNTIDGIGTVSPADYIVRVEVCDSGFIQNGDSCKQYPNGGWKPIGILQEYGENDRMLFGLLTGSYENNTSGGVLRKAVSSLTDEIDPNTGRFTSTVGVIGTIDRLQTIGFGGSYTYNSNCGWIVDRTINEGECRMWGNPIAEMMYESMRYFAGKGTPTGVFDIGATGNDDAALGLPLAGWDNPYATYPSCSNPVQMVISDVNPSYDTDQLPGSSFSSFSGDIAGLNVSDIADLIWDEEHGGTSMHFIGESGGVFDEAPTAKSVSSFADIRGLAPEEPTKEGGYYSASIAHYGFSNDLNTAPGDQTMSTYSIAMASPLPEFKINVGGQVVTLVPFAKSVGGFGISTAASAYQPTNTIVDFYVESISPTSGVFRVNFEDVEQGADHDMDAIVTYRYEVQNAAGNLVADPANGVQLEISLSSDYAAGGIIQHMGYVISGTSADGVYLEVRDADTAASSDPDYVLDTPNTSAALPLTTARVFTPSGTPAATLLRNPLWYAAKWGRFDDENASGIPDVQEEWDADTDGDPDNYFLVTNALTLSQQLQKAFNEILLENSSSAAIATNSTRLDTNTLIYQARFNSETWSGQLLAFSINSDGSVGAEAWDASQLIPSPASREIFTWDPDQGLNGSGVEFKWNGGISNTQKALLDIDMFGTNDGLGEERLDYLRGDDSLERDQAGGIFRIRPHALGDIVNSDPWFVGSTQDYGFRALPDDTEALSYPVFRDSAAYQNRPPMVYVGGNDGMLHAFNAQTGDELFAYVPNAAFPKLSWLTSSQYTHQYYVDGSPRALDAFVNGSWGTYLVGSMGAGGRAVYALDITDPDGFGSGDVMWEFAHPDLGYVIGQPSIARLESGDWVALVGNGYNSDDHEAKLLVIDLETGDLLKSIRTEVGDAGTPNGLSSPVPVDVNGDRVTDVVYAGDLLGNIWKFDLTGNGPSQWKSAFTSSGNPAPLFTAEAADGSVQPITARPNVGRHPDGGVMVYFGTGKYFETTDNTIPANPPVQTFYGIRDLGSTVSGRSQLEQQEIVYEADAATAGTSHDVRAVSDTEVDYAAKAGWYLDLIPPTGIAEGERVVDSAILRFGRVIFTSIIPSQDVCDYGGRSWLMELDAVNGSRLTYSVFDTNNSDGVDEGDFITLPDGTKVPSSGKGSDELISTPGIISAGGSEGSNLEYKYTSGSSGVIEVTTEQGGGEYFGRQSWRQDP